MYLQETEAFSFPPLQMMDHWQRGRGQEGDGAQQQESQESSQKLKVSFVCYEQSSRCKSMRDSSVSYAAAVVRQTQS